MSTTATYETVTEALRKDAVPDIGIRPGIAAAAELMLWHDGWPRRGDFRRLATSTGLDDGTVRIEWYRAADALRDNEFGPMSSSEHTVLNLAIMLATDQLGFSQLGNQHAAAVLRAFTAALPQAART